MTTFTCNGCGTPIDKTWQGRNPKWCSERCRKRSYGRPCIDCGAICNVDGSVSAPAVRCLRCANRQNGLERTVWTRDLIVARIREWAAIYGEPPAGPDWNPTSAAYINDPERADRFRAADGHWPHQYTVIRKFGSWNAAVTAAGFTTRANHGGGGNAQRRRNLLEKAA